MATRKYARTLKDLAAELKRDVASIHRWGGAGGPCTVDHRTDRGYLVEPVARWAREHGLLNGKPTAVGVSHRKEQPSHSERLKKYQAAERREKAILARLERRRVQGELMPVDEHEEHMLRTHRFFRTELETFMRRMPPRLAGRTIIEITKLLRDEVECMMRIWSKGGVYSNERADDSIGTR